MKVVNIEAAMTPQIGPRWIFIRPGNRSHTKIGFSPVEDTGILVGLVNSADRGGARLVLLLQTM